MNNQLFAALDKRKGYVFPAGQSLISRSTLQPGLRVFLTAGLLTGCKWYTLVSATSISKKKRVGKREVQWKVNRIQSPCSQSVKQEVRTPSQCGLVLRLSSHGGFLLPWGELCTPDTPQTRTTPKPPLALASSWFIVCSFKQAAPWHSSEPGVLLQSIRSTSCFHFLWIL